MMLNRILIIIVSVLCFVGAKDAGAYSITQTFTNSWSVDVWDYHGYVAAMQWQYQPYNATKYTPTSIELNMRISGSNLTTGDDFRYRSSFSTGWSPAAYQFYVDELFSDVSTPTLDIVRSYLFTSPDEISAWADPLYGPVGNYYFESTTFSHSHSLDVLTELTYNFSDVQPVPEPSSIILVSGGLAGLGYFVRRRRITG